MPRFIDIHKHVPGLTRVAAPGGQRADQTVGNPPDAKLLNYWLNEKNGTVLCLLEAPDKVTAMRLHLEVHGLIPDEINEVQEGS